MRKQTFIALVGLAVLAAPILGSARLDRVPDTGSAPPVGTGTCPGPSPEFVVRGLDWLVAAQQENGGWGAGSHANQALRDPHRVATDPATTAFAALALLRAGNTPGAGLYGQAVRHATERLIYVVAVAPDQGPRITEMTGTQPQVKLGNLIDTSMAVLFFSRLLPQLDRSDPLYEGVNRSLDKCLAKLQGSQNADGTWAEGGWAGVLQSSLGCSALEFARAAGKDVDAEVLSAARAHQQGNFDVGSGTASASDGAGVELYAYSSAQRATASMAKAARELVEEAKREGRLEKDAPVSADALSDIGVPRERATALSGAYQNSQAQVARLDDETMLQGFGSNGGEEFLSYMLTSESLVITGGEPWEKWNAQMQERLAGIQQEDGGWRGQHCITGGTFCTAAVLQCLTAENDAELLARISATDVATAKE